MSAAVRSVPRSAVVPVLRIYPLIGARWKPGHVIRRDTDAGTFEEVNSDLQTRTEILVQQALLRAKP